MCNSTHCSCTLESVCIRSFRLNRTARMNTTHVLVCALLYLCTCARAYTHVHTHFAGHLILALGALGWTTLASTARVSLSCSYTSALPFARHYLWSIWLSQPSFYLSFITGSLLTAHSSSQQPIIFLSHFIRPLLSLHTVLFPNSLQFSFWSSPFSPCCLLTHFIILNLASGSLYLPHPWQVQESPFQLFRLIFPTLGCDGSCSFAGGVSCLGPTWSA